MKRTIKIGKEFVFIILLIAMVLSCGETKKEKDSESTGIEEALEMESPQAPEPGAEIETVVDVVLDDQKFSMLGKGLKSAELVETWDNKDVTTLFAPTNDAFDKLPEGLVGDLMAPGGRKKLINILKYHTVTGMYDSDSLKSKVVQNNGTLELETRQGAPLKIMLEGDQLVLMGDNGDKANIVDTDIKADKGVVHAIDAVLLNE